MTGSCSCAPGFMGTGCRVACDVGYWGENCNKVCDCRNGASCDVVTGNCICSPGWTGIHCDEGNGRNLPYNGEHISEHVSLLSLK